MIVLNRKEPKTGYLMWTCSSCGSLLLMENKELTCIYGNKFFICPVCKESNIVPPESIPASTMTKEEVHTLCVQYNLNLNLENG